MFGFLRSSSSDASYRQSYARCCSFQHLLTGVSSLPFLSYESILLYQYAVDAGFSPGPPAGTKNCCRLQTSAALADAEDAPFAEFCVRFGMLLAAIKVEDDVRDNGSMISRLARWTYRNRFRASFEYFEKLDPGFEDKIRGVIAEHLEYEKSSGQPALTDYVQPTASAFGYVFSLFATLFPEDNEAHRNQLQQLGSCVGAAIISFDCAVDWHSDKWHGQFNPLPSCDDIDVAIDFCGDQLIAAGWLCAESFSPRSRTARLLKERFQTLEKSCCSAKRPVVQSRLEKWGIWRQPGFAYSRCDAGCCEIFAVCEVCGACGEGGAVCGEAGCCAGEAPTIICCVPQSCVDCCICTDQGFCDDPRARRKEEERRREQLEQSLVSQEGVAQTALRPSGTVSILGERFRAKAESSWIDAGENVVVVEEDDFGLVVRRVPRSFERPQKA